MSWTCPGHVLDLSICPWFWLQLLFLRDTEWLDSCESHVQLKSHNLSHEQLDISKSQMCWTKCKYFVQQCLCTILECIEVAQLYCIVTYFMLTSMFWCCLQVAYVLSILCPAIWRPCPEMITHYWCNVQDMSRTCPGHVLDVSSKLSIWSFFGRAFEGHSQLRWFSTDFPPCFYIVEWAPIAQNWRGAMDKDWLCVHV